MKEQQWQQQENHNRPTTRKTKRYAEVTTATKPTNNIRTQYKSTQDRQRDSEESFKRRQIPQVATFITISIISYPFIATCTSVCTLGWYVNMFGCAQAIDDRHRLRLRLRLRLTAVAVAKH